MVTTKQGRSGQIRKTNPLLLRRLAQERRLRRLRSEIRTPEHAGYRGTSGASLWIGPRGVKDRPSANSNGPAAAPA
jgi:hypothetical protein